MNQERLKKMNATLKEIVSRSIYQHTLEIQSDFGLITINHVIMAPDMSYLDVFVSAITNGEKLCKALAQYAQNVKEDINKEITLRKTPIVRFRYTDEMSTTTDLIKKINALEIKEI